MHEETIAEIFDGQVGYFRSGATRGYEFRVQQLTNLRSSLVRNEKAIHEALRHDLGKPEFETYLTEFGFCLHEIAKTVKHLKRWMRPRRVRTSILTQPGRSWIEYCPLGVNLIISPFNYPFMLLFSPLVAAIAAGNTVVAKTSELTPATSDISRTIIEETFESRYVAYIPGAVPETTALLQHPFDHIFFTGSPRVGSIVMQAAAKHLTPVTLELGGKSPCVVHKDAKLEVAVNRIIMGKFANAGQTCVAPDYVLVHADIEENFLSLIRNKLISAYGDDPSKSTDLGRIVSDTHHGRIAAMIDTQRVVVGAQSDSDDRFIAPTVLRDSTIDAPEMQEEIFGPVLPVLRYERFEDVYEVVAKTPKHPLACYVFSESKATQQELLRNLQFGGACINNTVFHVVNSYLPFGGVGNSGIGHYHGIHGFERFSHQRGILRSATWLDLPLLRPPYTKRNLNILKRVMK